MAKNEQPLRRQRGPGAEPEQAAPRKAAQDASQRQEQDVLQPARRKYRKEQKGRNKGMATRGNKVSFGEYGLKATGRGRLTARQIEAARRAMTRHIKRGGRIWIRIFPDKPISQKPAEVRMGNGKGNPEYWVAEIQPGKVLYEMDGVDEVSAQGGVPPRLGQAADRDHVRAAHGREPENMKASELRGKVERRAQTRSCSRCCGRSSACACRRPPSSSPTQPDQEGAPRHRARAHAPAPRRRRPVHE